MMQEGIYIIYYCIPLSILDKVQEFFKDKAINFTDIITYDEDLNIKFHKIKGKEYVPDFNYRKLFLDEQLQVARFGAMRAIKLKEKINNLINKNNNE